jgi:hypothetical protein
MAKPPQVHSVWMFDGDGNPVILSGNGGVPVEVLNAGSGGTASDFGSAFPALGTAAGAEDTNGNMAALSLDASGNLKVSGTLTVTPPASGTVSAAGPTAIGASSVQLLAANTSRKRLILQNVGTTRVYILFGAGTASSSNYHISLPAGGNANDGSSPIYSDTLWTGAIQAISSAAGGEVQAMEFTA